MARRSISGRLELTWMGKDKALIPSAEGVYDYDWVDKNDPRACQTHYLIDEGHVGDPDDDGIHDNLLVTGESGDVLEALTRVPELAEKYVGRVKCVYIDPPFNTEKTFTHYEDNLEHSVWLTMMRDRLVLLKKLLADDGSIWVHLDHSENHRMRVLLDEVFGSENFVAEVVWQKADSPRNSARHLSVDQDVILLYAKCAEEWRPNKLPRTAALDAKYTNPDNDPKGPWFGDNLRANKPYSLGTFVVTGPTGRDFSPKNGRYWRISEAKFKALDSAGEIWWGSNGDSFPTMKRYLSTVGAAVPRTLWLSSEVGSNRTSTNEIKALFGEQVSFSTPKPERLLERIIKIATDPSDIVLDCFAGSGTTAAVAHKAGRRWVTCELLPETMTAFTRPRLEKVVAGEDLGGVTQSVGYEAAGDLPGGTSVDEARAAATVLNRAVKALEDAGTELDAETLKALKDTIATKKVTTVQWPGGGGFDVARLSPVWVRVENGSMFTTEAATGEVLARSIAAHLGFRWTGDDDLRFAGRKGRQRLAVVEGLLTAEKSDELRSALEPDETVTVACFGAEEGVDEALRRDVRGSRVLVIPDDLFSFDPEASEEVES